MGKPEAEKADVKDIVSELDGLAGSERPFIVGVRHHSPALSAVMGELLEGFRPDHVLIELPTEFAHWVSWLGDPELRAPVALAGVHEGTDELFFYPFADFSPELAAIRWATAKGIPVEPFDLAAGARVHVAQRVAVSADSEPRECRLVDGLHRAVRTSDFESLWDRLVEVQASGANSEAVRRAALYVGWALRRDCLDDNNLQDLDRMRETAMRARLSELGAYTGQARVAVIVGAFHGPALIEEPTLFESMDFDGDIDDIVTSLIPYSFELLDSRSGYPAGIRDPMWQQRVWQALTQDQSNAEVVSDAIVSICRNVRASGHVAGVPDADAAMGMAQNLAAIRGLAAPGRQEVIESIQSALGQGEPLGRALVLARAMERALVGKKRGRLAAGTPRSGLYPHVVELLEELRLPGPGSESAESLAIRLDPMRSDLDSRRHVTLERLCACKVPYATREQGQAIGLTDTLTRRWSVRWQPGTEAVLEVAGLRGVRLDQAATGALRAEEARLRKEEKWTAVAMLHGLRAAAECSLATLARERIVELEGPFLDEADLVLVLEALHLLEQIEGDHIPGFKAKEILENGRPRRSLFLAAAVRALDGLIGSKRLEDARAVIALVSIFQRQGVDDELGQSRLVWLVNRFAEDGAPMMQGTGCAARLLMGGESEENFSERLGSWVDSATSPEAMRQLTGRLQGVLAAAAPLLEASPECMRGLIDQIDALRDDEFLKRLASLRDGFNVLSPASRQRFLATILEAFPKSPDPRGHEHSFVLEDTPELLSFWSEADLAGKKAIEAVGLGIAAMPLDAASEDRPDVDTGSAGPRKSEGDAEIDSLSRWRLILGRERDRLVCQTAARAGRALDELYGQGRGEGAHGDLGGDGGGKELSFPTAREWAEELEDLFGASVRDEVLSKAGESGRHAALLEINPETVTPSIELLERILSLKGSLSEVQTVRLRKLIDRVVKELVKELATRLRPALTGLITPRPTLRKGGPIDLKRTIERNLKHSQIDEDGGWRLVPHNVYFKSRARPATDWEIFLVVDVSGSMEASTIYSAMMAAIFHGLPSVRVHFISFNTEVIDLSDQVDDPLSLLLEVEVGGGTHIAKGLRYARGLIKVPARSLVILVSDFEEGWEASGLVQEARAIVESGAQALGIAALDDGGKPRFNKAIAEMVVSVGMPVAALSPLELARWVGEKIHG
ncbi:MAG: DUF5682 family protein, partial [Bradymonadaceae bacterium]